MKLLAIKILNALVILGSLAIIAVLSIELLSTTITLDNQEVLNWHLIVCVIFMADFWVRFSAAKRKFRYFWHNIIFFLISIPFLNIFHYIHGEISPEAYFLLRLLPLLRGAFGLAIVINFFTRSRISSLFLIYIVTIGAMTYFASLVFYSLEQGINPGVSKFSDALWWAFMDVTTVGSNIYAVTGVGRFMSVVLAGAGMMMFPIFTAYITSKFQTMVKSSSTEERASIKVEQK